METLKSIKKWLFVGAILLPVFLMLFNINGFSAEAAGKMIVVNPGHMDGSDPGAVNSSNGIREVDLNNALAIKTVATLRNSGYNAMLSHPVPGNPGLPTLLAAKPDYNVYTKTICDTANAKGADLLISIHHNSGGNASGYELYWSSYHPTVDNNGIYQVFGLWSDGGAADLDISPPAIAIRSKELANSLNENFKSLGYVPTRNKVVERDDSITRRTSMPSVLIEAGFVSNSAEAVRLANGANQQKMADQTLKSVNTFFGTQAAPMTATGVQASVSGTKITATVKGITAPNGIKQIQIPIWSELNGQDDLKWYTATVQADGNYGVTIDTKDHKNDIGVYNIHCYGTDNGNKLTMLGNTTVQMTVPMTATSLTASVSGSKITATIKGITAPNGIKQIQVPVWSELNGQDDLKWYTATAQSDGSYSVTIDTTNHKNNTGVYNIHCYGTDNSNGTVGLGTTTATVTTTSSVGMTATSLTASVSGTKITATVKGITAPNGIKQIQVPVWSDLNGQDDIKWYAASVQSDGSYTVTIDATDHKNNTGVYNIHCYGTDNSNTTVGLGATTATITKIAGMTATSLTASVSGTKITATVKGITAPNGIKQIQVPVWSELNGQDDIKWYTASAQSDGSYSVTIDAKDHKNNTGAYNIHCYGTDNSNTTVGLGVTTATITTAANMTADSLTAAVSGSEITVTVKGVTAPNGIKQIQIPIWSDVNGQDDLKWYIAVAQADGSYSVTIDTKDHKNDTGIYNIHCYGTDNSGKIVGLGAMTTTIVTVSNTGMTAASVEASVSGNKITITIADITAPNGIKQIQVPVWSDLNGQDDLKWYIASAQADGSYSVTIDIKDHKNDIGVYNIHCYGTDNSGKVVGLGVTTAMISNIAGMTATSLEASLFGNKVTITITGITAPNGIKQIQVPVWSEVNGQDDLKWYTASAQSNGSYSVTIDSSDHKNDTGIYNIHCYGIDNSNKMIMLGSATIDVKITTPIMGTTSVSAQQLINYYKGTGAVYPQKYNDLGVNLETFVSMYIQEANTEGVRAEIAFAQAMLETGNLQFGGDVKVGQFNFAGLGATGAGVPGFDFAATYGDSAIGIRTGIRGHVQHLKCYACDQPLNQVNVDPRWATAIRLRAIIVEGLSGTWAADTQYAPKILAIMKRF